MATEKTASAKEIPVVDKKNKTCFIVAPIGSEGSDIRRAIEGLLDAVLRPVLQESHGYEVEIAHKISASGSISDQIMNFLLESDLVVVDLTGLNPNVMYELAIRHCIGLPLIVIAREGTNLPFDVVQERTIFYQNDMHGAVDLKDRLNNAVKTIVENGDQIDNPVTRSRQAKVVREKLKSGEGGEADVLKFVLDQISDLKAIVSRVPTAQPKYVNRNYSGDLNQVHGLSSVGVKEFLVKNGFTGFSVNESNDDGRPGFKINFRSKLSEEDATRLFEVLMKIRDENHNFVITAADQMYFF